MSFEKTEPGVIKTERVAGNQSIKQASKQTLEARKNVGETVTKVLVGVAAQIAGKAISRLLFWICGRGYSEILG